MARRIEQGRWVEIRRVVLHPGQRAPQIPEDTGQVPLEMRVKGFLAEPAKEGEEAEIVTVTGRRLRGILDVVDPAYTHSFGAPVAQLLGIGQEVRATLKKQDASG